MQSDILTDEVLTSTKKDRTIHQQEDDNKRKLNTSEDGNKIPSNPLALEKTFLSDHVDANAEVEKLRFEDLPKYQKSNAFPPDQLPVWNKFNPNHLTDCMTMECEKAFVFEIASLRKALLEVKKRGALRSWECESIKAWWEGHYLWVNTRYPVFRDIFIPRLGRRFHFPEDVKHALDACNDKLQTISAMIVHLKDYDTLCNLLRMWLTYEEQALQYVYLSERKMIPLYHAFFSPHDSARITRWLVNKNESTRTGAFINFIGVDRFRSRVLPRENYPSISWSLNFKKHYDAYIENSVAHLDALVSGKPTGQSQESSLVEKCRKRRRTMEQDEYIYFNPFDPVYQVSKEFLPDKLEEWEEDFEDHVKDSSRYAVNQAHLGEIKDMMVALMAIRKRGDMADWEMLSINEWFHAHKEFITQLDVLNLERLYPFYETRFVYPKVLKDGHKEISKMLVQISFFLASWQAGDKIDALVDVWTRYFTKVDSFFELFNRIHFPLVHAYFSRAEIAELVSSLVSDGVPGTGPIVYYKGKEKFRKDFMRKLQLNDVHWHLSFGGDYISYVERIVVHINALKSGAAPNTSRKADKPGKILSHLDDLWDDCGHLDQFLQDIQ